MQDNSIIESKSIRRKLTRKEELAARYLIMAMERHGGAVRYWEAERILGEIMSLFTDKPNPPVRWGLGGYLFDKMERLGLVYRDHHNIAHTKASANFPVYA